MVRSPALNPSSTPFFPGVVLSGKDEGGGPGLFRQVANRNDQDRVSIASSSFSVSSSEYRSVRSSPSPSQGDPNDLDKERSNSCRRSPSSVDGSRASPAFRSFEANRAYSGVEARTERERSFAGSIENYPERNHTEDSDEIGVASMGHRPGHESLFHTPAFAQSRELLATPPVSGESNGSNPTPVVNNIPPPIVSSSPSSSLDSSSYFASNMEFLNFEAQLKSSPIINDIVDRLIRYESVTREIQRDLGDVHRKVNVLLERSLSNPVPEFKDPFAPNNLSNASMNGPRASIPLAPHQLVPNSILSNHQALNTGLSGGDDVGQISQRLNALTSSVGQLLALQTQNFQATNIGLSKTPGGLGGGLQQDIAPNQIIAPPLNSAAMLGHGLPSSRGELRNSPRPPAQPIRTWSAGSLDLPPRAVADTSASLRQDAMLRDKRRSTVGLIRRESSSVDSLVSTNMRDGGPAVTKWDQLAVAPELLRSLVKFGVGPPNKIQQRALPFLLRGADIIAQAPPTQERIAAYVIPAIHIALTVPMTRIPRGPLVVMISTTVDQATQAQRMIRDLGGPIGVRSALGVGSAANAGDVAQELRHLHQNMPHIICGTPQKLHALFTSSGAISGSEVRFLVLDEVDQLIARNLHDFVFNIVKLLPPPRSRPVGNNGSNGSPSPLSQQSSFSLELNSTFQTQSRRFSGISEPPEQANGSPNAIERQSALFSNTVPQDVLNLATAIQLREPVRVLVRRDGNVTQADTGQGARGLRQFYLYLAFTAGGRSDAPVPANGLGIIGSGRGASSAETAQAREWKLDALVDVFDDIEVPQAIVHVGGMTALDAVVYKLASRGLEAVPLHGDMNAGSKLAAINKFRSSAPPVMRTSPTKVLVVYDVQVKTPDVSQIPLVVNYDLPKAVEEYAHRVAPAIAPNYARAGVVINFVTATGGDVEMLRSIECFYKIKCPEVPMSLRDIV